MARTKTPPPEQPAVPQDGKKLPKLANPVKPLPELPLQVLCPTSNMSLDGKKIIPHLMKSFLCRGNRAIQSKCFLHQAQSFINNPMIVSAVIEMVNQNRG